MGACLNQLLGNETKESLAVMADRLIGIKLELEAQVAQLTKERDEYKFMYEGLCK
jgi:hypothetical protein